MTTSRLESARRAGTRRAGQNPSYHLPQLDAIQDSLPRLRGRAGTSTRVTFTQLVGMPIQGLFRPDLMLLWKRLGSVARVQSATQQPASGIKVPV